MDESQVKKTMILLETAEETDLSIELRLAVYRRLSATAEDVRKEAERRLIARDPDEKTSLGHIDLKSFVDPLSGPLRQRISNWRQYAYQALNDYADNELENALNKTSDVDDASLALGLAAGIMNGLAAAFPIEGAVLRPFFQQATTSVLQAVGSHQIQAAGSKPSDRPITAVKRMVEVVAEQSEQAFYASIPGVIEDVIDTLRMLNVQPIEADVFNRACIQLFGFDNVTGDGMQTEVSPQTVKSFFESTAVEKLKDYMKEVEPIGEGRFGHKKVMLIKIMDLGPEYDALGVRKGFVEALQYVDGKDERYEFMRWVDDDMVAAGMARNAAAGEPDITSVSKSSVDKLPPGDI